MNLPDPPPTYVGVGIIVDVGVVAGVEFEVSDTDGASVIVGTGICVEGTQETKIKHPRRKSFIIFNVSSLAVNI